MVSVAIQGISVVWRTLEQRVSSVDSRFRMLPSAQGKSIQEIFHKPARRIPMRGARQAIWGIIINALLVSPARSRTDCGGSTELRLAEGFRPALR